MKDVSFALFIATYLLIQIPFSFYFSYCSLFLNDKGFKFITGTMGWGVVAEMFLMLRVPVVITRVGLKWAMTIGLVALVVRYASFLLGEVFGQRCDGGILPGERRGQFAAEHIFQFTRERDRLVRA